MSTLQNLTTNQTALPEIKTPELPKTPEFSGYDIPNLPKIEPVEKPSFSKYFETNLKPMLGNLMQEQLKNTQPLVQQFASQYQEDVKPLTNQLAASIYGSNVGATSGLGQEAYAKGVGQIMKPVTNYALDLQGNIIGNYNKSMSDFANQGMELDYKQQINDYSTAQDRLYEQGQQSYKDTLAKKKYAADLLNQFEMSKFGINADISKMGYANTLTQSNMALQDKYSTAMAGYQNALQQGDMALANKYQQEIMGIQQSYTQGNMEYQSILNEKQAEADNARQQGNMQLANKLQQDNMALQQSYTVKNMETQDKYSMAMAGYQNALQQGNMTLANTFQQQAMKVQQDYNIQNSMLNNLLGKDDSEYQNALQQGNMKLAARLEQDANDRKTMMDMALSGKMGQAGADFVAKEFGLSPEFASAIKTANRDEILNNYWNQQIANNLPIDERVMNALAVVNGGGTMTDAEKKKYLTPETTILPPTNAYRTLIDNADKETLAAWGFKHESKTKDGALFGLFKESYWVMDLPENVKHFDELYKTNKDFRDWVATQI